MYNIKNLFSFKIKYFYLSHILLRITYMYTERKFHFILFKLNIIELTYLFLPIYFMFMKIKDLNSVTKYFI